MKLRMTARGILAIVAHRWLDCSARVLRGARENPIRMASDRVRGLSPQPHRLLHHFRALAGLSEFPDSPMRTPRWSAPPHV